MTEGIDAIGGVGSNGSKPIDMQTQNIEAQQSEPALSGGRFDALTRGAVDQIFSNKIGAGSGDPTRNSILGSDGGQIGDEKREIQSTVERPGVEGTESAEKPDDTMQPMIDRMNSLYKDITIFNVAWGVATRVQRDISQLMRGS